MFRAATHTTKRRKILYTVIMTHPSGASLYGKKGVLREENKEYAEVLYEKSSREAIATAIGQLQICGEIRRHKPTTTV